MSEIRVQVAYHFKVDPAQLTPGCVVQQLPEMITRTVAVGDFIATEKVAAAALPAADRAALVAELETQARAATRTAKPLGAHLPENGEDWQEKKDELRAF